MINVLCCRTFCKLKISFRDLNQIIYFIMLLVSIWCYMHYTTPQIFNLLMQMYLRFVQNTCTTCAGLMILCCVIPDMILKLILSCRRGMFGKTSGTPILIRRYVSMRSVICLNYRVLQDEKYKLKHYRYSVEHCTSCECVCIWQKIIIDCRKSGRWHPSSFMRTQRCHKIGYFCGF